MTDLVRFIEGEELAQWAQDGEGKQSFRYRQNMPGTWFLIVVGGLASIVAVLVWWRSHGLPLWIHKIGFSICVAFSLWCAIQVVHWSIFCARNYIVFSDRHLLIGRGPRAYLLPRSRLTRTAIDVENMMPSKWRSELPIRIDDYERRVLLVGAMATLHPYPVFMEYLLTMIHDNDPEDADVAADEAS